MSGQLSVLNVSPATLPAARTTLVTYALFSHSCTHAVLKYAETEDQSPIRGVAMVFLGCKTAETNSKRGALRASNRRNSLVLCTE